MTDIIPYYKPLGFTPLQAIGKLKTEHPELDSVPLTYAGRLDPMAEGLLLLLKGEAIVQKQKLLDLPKTYEAEILFGFASDTYDILGLPSRYEAIEINKIELELALNSFLGTHTFPYPGYSSKPVYGKPMWHWAREGKLEQIQIPTRAMTVHTSQLTQLRNTSWLEIYQTINNSINLINGDFRQNEILAQWADINNVMPKYQKLQIANITFDVSSGTYIRTLAHEIGKHFKINSLLYKLKRTQIGKYKIV